MDDTGWDEWFAQFRAELDLPCAGLRVLTELRATLDSVERLFVARARRNRASWAEVGSALGISRQAAYMRHRPVVNMTDGDSPRQRG